MFQPPIETPSYIRPESSTPAEYSKVLLQMFDAYPCRLSEAQRCFRKLPWGKPVRAGQHLPGTLDWKKRGAPPFLFNWDEEDDDYDFEIGQPPSKKFSTDRDWQKQKHKGMGVSQGVRVSARSRANSDGSLFIDPGGAGDSASVRAAYEAETQQSDAGEYLPGLRLGSADTVGKSRPGDEGDDGQRWSPSPTATPASGGGSQSSNYLLDDNGDLYPTQLPPRKRRAGRQTPDTVCENERPKRLCRTVQPSWRGLQKGDGGAQPLSRKRKQASPDDEVFTLLSDDDDEEISFPQKRKVSAAVREQGFVHISSSSDGGASRLNVVLPQPRRGGAPCESGSGVQREFRVIAEAEEGSPFKPIRQGASSVSADAEPGPCSGLAEESDDSVQFVEAGAEGTGAHSSQSTPPAVVRDAVISLPAAPPHSQPTEQTVFCLFKSLTLPK